MAQNQYSAKLKEIATTIATSTSPGTAANTMALAVVLWYSLPNFLPPLSSGSAIAHLENAIKELADIYGRHKSILGDRASFENEFKKLKRAALELKEKHIQNLDVSWKSLPTRLAHEKYVWATARVHRREVGALKSKLELTVIEAEKRILFENEGAVNDEGEDRTAALTIDASIAGPRLAEYFVP
ncbi:hypothetical protein ARMSODRAFT_1019279 [Armillaria solidipes]|uniref:Uncharacterized protein n=1 Tax=Armillaria solidipes TaxID=1076256 RepID=A0A2H3BXP7_9AGAR|nr:hypothetical protein ARMSODRAFT_1019279 [Armillaria solidipes]